MAPNGQPAFTLYAQTFGDLVTFNPHMHALVADGVFLPSGTFRVVPRLPEAALCDAPRRHLRHGDLPPQTACDAEVQLPVDAGARSRKRCQQEKVSGLFIRKGVKEKVSGLFITVEQQK
jgi:hypothetical protein